MLSPDGIRIKKNRNYLMIDIGRGDQENFEIKLWPKSTKNS